MAQFTISLDPAAAALYLRVAQAAGKPVEEVLADALFKLAGELSLEALQARGHTGERVDFLGLAGQKVSEEEFAILIAITYMEAANMKSIRDIYKIGRGPSSSHTMGPERAARLFLSEHPEADRIEVVLYGSLCKTGVGHGTDRVLREVLQEVDAEIVFSKEDPVGIQHPNTMDFFAYQGPNQTGHIRVESVGGGDIVILGRPADPSAEIYPENSFAEVRDFCKWRYINTLSEYVEMNEGPEIWDFLREVWKAMQQSITDGLSTTGILPGGLNVERKAKQLYENQLPTEVAQVLECRIICAYAYAVSEQNADNGIIVTAPTCGAAGVMPALLYAMRHDQSIGDRALREGMLAAAAVAFLAKRNAAIAGAEVGCQGEVGVASAMAAALVAHARGASAQTTENAAEIALEHHLGLTCDPVGGYVQIPCIERNAMGAVKAYNAFLLASTENPYHHRVSLDSAIAAMAETGREMNAKFKETSLGGLAVSMVNC